MDADPRSLDAVLIYNGQAGKAKQDPLLRELLLEHHGVELCETRTAEDALLAAEIAVRQQTPLVIAAGGDGTIHAVVNGLMKHGSPATTLGVIPMGTANDFAATLAMPDDPAAAMQLVMARAQTRRLDCVRADLPEGTHYFINTSAGGNSQRVNECLDDETKQRWGSLCYVRGAIDLLADLQGFEATITFDDEPPQAYSVWNIMLGNGRMSAGRLPIAPRANPEDGLLEVMIVLDGDAGDLAALAAQFVLSDYLESDQVVYRRAQRLRIEAEPAMQFSADGDQLGSTPITFTVEPQALNVVVGPSYSAMPLEAAQNEEA